MNGRIIHRRRGRTSLGDSWGKVVREGRKLLGRLPPCVWWEPVCVCVCVCISGVQSAFERNNTRHPVLNHYKGRCPQVCSCGKQKQCAVTGQAKAAFSCFSCVREGYC